MAHPRKLIRQAAKALLSGTTAAGARVEASRTNPIKHTQLPSIGIYTESDTVDWEHEGIEEKHDLELKIAGWVVNTSAVPGDDAMDDLAEQIESAMASDRFLGGAAGGQGVLLQGTETTILADGGADPLIGRVVLTYAATYFQIPGATVPTDEFLRTNATTQIAGAGDDNTVDDQFNQRP